MRLKERIESLRREAATNRKLMRAELAKDRPCVNTVYSWNDQALGCDLAADYLQTLVDACENEEPVHV